MSRDRRRAVRLRLCVLGLLALGAGVAFMGLGAGGNWAFVLPFRAVKLAALVLVGAAVAIATVLFQTLTHNRILTPSLIGFDALYGLLQTVMVAGLGLPGIMGTDPRLVFLLTVVLMVGLSQVFFRLLLERAGASLTLLLLAGILCGTFFRSLAELIQRMLNPNDFVVLQDRLFASFNSVDESRLALAAVLVAGAGLAALPLVRRFDVMALGRERAIALGLDYRRTARQILSLVAVLVSVSTALVGPVTFFGLLVANLAWALLPTHRHAAVLPGAVLIAVITLVGGQAVLERLLHFATALPVVIEFAGGLFFLSVLMLRARP